MATTFEVLTPKGKQLVTGSIVGPFGINKDGNSANWGGWAVTHLGTGLAVAMRYTRRDARALALKLAPMADWNEIKGPADFNALPHGVRERIRDAARSIR